MLVIPAIDLKDGQAVRLKQGDFNRSTVYSSDPLEVALRWEDAGAGRIHIVDLDGSLAGTPRNREVIRRIAGRIKAPIELGGGIRDLATIESYFDAGIRFAILGSVALKKPELVEAACAKFPGRIIVGIDARDGMAAVEGWTEATRRTAIELAGRFEQFSLDSIIYTDINRDGMETGVNVEATRKLAEAVKVPIIASGGVAGLRDIRELRKVEQSGIMGVIIGKALYTGAINLEEAIKVSQSK
ncbi:MAG: 1-(5-phosphoribosyl)-5-[(5-phosphoribosylamino)methylideneamino]imidazole-4-carboxamide isomerase [Syntrophaceae bacterium]